MKIRTCWITRNQFLVAVGIVNADITLRGTTTVTYRTKYMLVAERIASLAKSIGCTFQRTITEDGTYVISAKGFYPEVTQHD